MMEPLPHQIEILKHCMNEEDVKLQAKSTIERLKDYKGEIFMVEQESLDEHKFNSLKAIDERINELCSAESFPLILNPLCLHLQSNLGANLIIKMLKDRKDK